VSLAFSRSSQSFFAYSDLGSYTSCSFLQLLRVWFGVCERYEASQRLAAEIFEDTKGSLITPTYYSYAHRACSTNHAPAFRTPSPRRFLKALACVSHAQSAVSSTTARSLRQRELFSICCALCPHRDVFSGQRKHPHVGRCQQVLVLW